MFPWRVIKWHILDIAKAHFKYTIWFIISEKSIMRCTVSSRCMHGTKSLTRHTKKVCFKIFRSFSPKITFMWTFTDMNTYKLTEGRNFKILLKANYTAALDSCYMFTKKTLNIELNIMLIVLIEYAYIRDSFTLQQFPWIPCTLRRWWIWQIEIL